MNSLAWLVKNLDLNPDGNLWSILVKNLYASSTQLTRIEELKTELIRCWEIIDEEILHRLINSTSKRLADVLRMHGSKVKY